MHKYNNIVSVYFNYIDVDLRHAYPALIFLLAIVKQLPVELLYTHTPLFCVQ